MKEIKRAKTIQKNLKIQIESSNRLQEISRETGLTQSFIVQYLIDDFAINKYKHSNKDEAAFNLFQ